MNVGEDIHVQKEDYDDFFEVRNEEKMKKGKP